MIEVKFKKYEGGSSLAWEQLGSVKSLVGKGGEIGFIKPNFNNPNKNIALLLKNAAGESLVVVCRPEVTKLVREKKMSLPQLAGLPVIGAQPEGAEEPILLVVLPGDSATVMFKADDIKEETTEVSETSFLPEELVAF